MEQLGAKICNELFTKLKSSLEHIHVEIGTIQQFLPGVIEAMTGKQHPTVMELHFTENLPIPSSKTAVVGVGKTMELGALSGSNEPST